MAKTPEYQLHILESLIKANIKGLEEDITALYEDIEEGSESAIPVYIQATGAATVLWGIIDMFRLFKEGDKTAEIYIKRILSKQGD